MREGWIQLECADCGEQWTADPADLPAPGNRYDCDHCGSERPIAEFAKTPQGLNILEEFHERPA